MFSQTLINEVRFGVSREHTNRMPPFGADTGNIPAKYGITGIPQVDGNGSSTDSGLGETTPDGS